ncbi:hypothetical protein ABT120_61035 [Nonomuraea angiospora]|uniref:hypothetical protein n=1 Tax=Nonomuraea angiospora TaxID=46172 RepID=UPI0033329A37
MRRVGAVAAYLGVMLTTTAMSMPLGGHRGRGNSWNSGNYWSKGRQVNSGNFSFAKGSPNSNNVHSGSNFANGFQCIHERRSIVKPSC